MYYLDADYEFTWPWKEVTKMIYNFYSINKNIIYSINILLSQRILQSDLLNSILFLV